MTCFLEANYFLSDRGHRPGGRGYGVCADGSLPAAAPLYLFDGAGKSTTYVPPAWTLYGSAPTGVTA